VDVLQQADPRLGRRAALRQLLHNETGRATTEHLFRNDYSRRRKEEPMTRTESLQKALKSAGGVVRLCKGIADSGDSFEITENELTDLINQYADQNKKPGESVAKAFSRLFSATAMGMAKQADADL
jgi:hypothetical protein